MMPERGRRSRIRGVNRRRFLTGGLTALGVLGLRPGQTSSQAGAGAPKNRLTLPLVAGDSVTVETMRQLANRKGITFGLYEAVLTSCPVHPHACGDDAVPALAAPEAAGSPPRVWGRRSRRRPPLGVRRFTPNVWGDDEGIEAGFTYSDGSPHACGDNMMSGAPA